MDRESSARAAGPTGGLHYWVDEEHGKIFCLVEAPDADTAVRVHREAHGLEADEIYPVTQGA